MLLGLALAAVVLLGVFGVLGEENTMRGVAALIALIAVAVRPTPPPPSVGEATSAALFAVAVGELVTVPGVLLHG